MPDASTHLDTAGIDSRQRAQFVRDTAFHLFGLEAKLGQESLSCASADIHVFRRAGANLVDVQTSNSVVTRTARRAHTMQGGNLLVYLIRQGGSSFENAHGDQFTTRPHSIVVGSQDAAYRAAAAPGADWSFTALSVPADHFPVSGHRIRAGGFMLLQPHAPFGSVLSSFTAQLFSQFALMTPASSQASLTALDHLLGAALGQPTEIVDDLAHALDAQRRQAALDYVTRELANGNLQPGMVAQALRLSKRQLERAFETGGTTIADEIRRARVRRAKQLLGHQGAQSPSITEVAFACGFESLATFYRVFKSIAGVTASEWRDQSREKPAS